MTNGELITQLQELIINKRVNILLGSGTSDPGMPMMRKYWSDELQDYDVDKLLEEIKNRNEELLWNNIDVIETFMLIETMDDICETLLSYSHFLEIIINLLAASNSRQSPKTATIFTTNYDLFIEKAADGLLNRGLNFVFTDGANGYFKRILDSHNFDKIVSYKGQFDNFINEIPSLSLVKPHGSVNWKKTDSGNKILIDKGVVKDGELVKPNGEESKDTMVNQHFYEMLRLFSYELEKKQAILIVHGFSFGDEHILNMVKRGLENNELHVIVFAYTDDAKMQISEKFSRANSLPRNLNILSPEDFSMSDTKLGLPNLNSILRGKITGKDEKHELSSTHDTVEIIEEVSSPREKIAKKIQEGNEGSSHA